MKSVGREGRVQFEGGFGEGVKSWVGVAGLRPPPNASSPNISSSQPQSFGLFSIRNTLLLKLSPQHNYILKTFSLENFFYLLVLIRVT